MARQWRFHVLADMVVLVMDGRERREIGIQLTSLHRFLSSRSSVTLRVLPTLAGATEVVPASTAHAPSPGTLPHPFGAGFMFASCLPRIIIAAVNATRRALGVLGNQAQHAQRDSRRSQASPVTRVGGCPLAALPPEAHAPRAQPRWCVANALHAPGLPHPMAAVVPSRSRGCVERVSYDTNREQRGN
jgi:hypothetical protein